MKENGSPDLVFEPANDTDDYTMVTAYINEEYAGIQSEESEKSNRQENRQETSDDKTSLEKEIITCLINNPKSQEKNLPSSLEFQCKR